MDTVQQQRAYLLRRIEEGNGPCGWSKLTAAKVALKKAGLSPDSAREVIAQLIGEGRVEEHRRGKGISYGLTDSGKEYLATLIPPSEQENLPLLQYRKAYLLLQLL